MSTQNTIEITDRRGTRLIVESDGTDISAMVVPKVGSADGSVPSVDLDEVDRERLRSWLSAVVLG
jgi:hypothetical protein